MDDKERVHKERVNREHKRKLAAGKFVAQEDVCATLAERGKTHGDFGFVAAVSQDIKEHITINSGGMGPEKVEALDMIATKIARILCGNPNEPDHWKDIEGYARLARESIK